MIVIGHISPASEFQSCRRRLFDQVIVQYCDEHQFWRFAKTSLATDTADIAFGHARFERPLKGQLAWAILASVQNLHG
jgi:hypothetical protein